MTIFAALTITAAASGMLMPPVLRDDDRDGFYSTIDCNDDDALVNPNAAETANGFDDDCNGVVDDGFDTTMDRPRIDTWRPVWPFPGARAAREFAAVDAPPRIVWTGEVFVAVWADLVDRLRLTRIARDGTPLDTPPLVLRRAARAPDLAWTGSRLGIAYEDRSTGRTSVHLLLLDPGGPAYDDVVVAPAGSQPKIVWGQDRFGVVWKTPDCAGDCLRFQRFDRHGLSVSSEETLADSGDYAAIAWSGAGVRLGPELIDVHPGYFGIVYEARYGRVTSGDVFLTARPRDPWEGQAVTTKANEHEDLSTRMVTVPAIAGNAAGFAVSWRVAGNGGDRGTVRFFSLATLTPVQEFEPDADVGRYGRIVWTGSEFVLANDNVVATTPARLDVHLRRVDPTGNPHLAAGWGPWSELVVCDVAPGLVSARPDLATDGRQIAVVWVQEDPSLAGYGRIWIATVAHD